VQTGQTVGTIAVSLSATGTYTSTGAAITSVNVLSDGKGGYTFTDQNNQAITAGVASNIFTSGSYTGAGTAITSLALNATLATAMGATASGVAAAGIAQINAINSPPTVSGLDISTVTGANQAMVSIDNALQTVNTLQASLGAAQNRFTAIATAQQAESTDLSSAQSQITDANFAQETANLSKAQVLQQAGISVLAQANSNPQQVLKLLQ
jgi:flagellin